MVRTRGTSKKNQPQDPPIPPQSPCIPSGKKKTIIFPNTENTKRKTTKKGISNTDPDNLIHPMTSLNTNSEPKAEKKLHVKNLQKAKITKLTTVTSKSSKKQNKKHIEEAFTDSLEEIEEEEDEEEKEKTTEDDQDFSGFGDEDEDEEETDEEENSEGNDSSDSDEIEEIPKGRKLKARVENFEDALQFLKERKPKTQNQVLTKTDKPNKRSRSISDVVEVQPQPKKVKSKTTQKDHPAKDSKNVRCTLKAPKFDFTNQSSSVSDRYHGVITSSTHLSATSSRQITPVQEVETQFSKSKELVPKKKITKSSFSKPIHDAMTDVIRVELFTGDAFPTPFASESILSPLYYELAGRDLSPEEKEYFQLRYGSYRNHLSGGIKLSVRTLFGYSNLSQVVHRMGGKEQVLERLRWEEAHFAWENADWHDKESLVKKKPWQNSRCIEILGTHFINSPHSLRIPKLQEAFEKEIPATTIALTGTLIVHGLKTIAYYVHNPTGTSPPSFTKADYYNYYLRFLSDWVNAPASVRRQVFDKCEKMATKSVDVPGFAVYESD